MSDLTEAAPVDAPEISEAPVDAPEAAPEAEATGFAVEPTIDADLPDGVDKFDRGYVTKIREEAAKYRTEYAPFRDAFDGYDPEDRDALLTLAKELQENPSAAARRMLEASRAIAGDDFEKWVTGDDQPEYLTPEALDARLQERESQQRLAAETAAIQKEAIDLGYQENTADHAKLFWLAANQTNGDLKAAHEAIAAEKQAVIDAYVAEIKAKGERFPTTPTQVTGQPSNQGENSQPRTIDDASRLLRERLAALAEAE